jgi:hypothetical protein
MTTPQIVAVAAAACVALLYAWPALRLAMPTAKQDPTLLTHLRNVIAVRDSYKTPEVTQACNDLMEALLGIK